MALSPHQKTTSLILWARWLGYVALGFFALAMTAILGWERLLPHQIAVGLAGFVIVFAVSLWILRFLPREADDTGTPTISPLPPTRPPSGVED
ncbi:hypothetical protein QOZ96_000669 [Brevundimonas nasdae]|jgi:hypothetical protein|uniref:hypothetical protein n=1 Tax=Brevundimonas nasdae TaxID=172043 RepID=UPI001912741D|nr:hypothetical protein [Brevundimonas nasdae]MBK6024083.1 hypothetical protein [Brevundimonas nasdae]MDQ0450738.1 hypothetical protein [Brevundimonas nasdae]